MCKFFNMLCLCFLLMIFFQAFAFADTRINTSKDAKTLTITNSEAKEAQRYVKSLDKGNSYKNYRVFTPKKLETIDPAGAPSSPQASAPAYQHYDVSHVANAHKILGPIVVSVPGGGNVDISPIILAESRRHNVDPVLVMTVIKFESGFCSSAVSPVGACGLMQLMPDTARSLGVSDVFSPHQNIAGGVLYIRRQLDAFNNNVAFALAAYNAGPGAVSAYGGIPPYAETINYVNMILADYTKGGRVSLKQPQVKAQEEPEPRNVDIFSTLTRMRNKSHSSDDRSGQE